MKAARGRRTGIFMPYFRGDRLSDFPAALAGILEKENVHYHDAVYLNANGSNYVKPATEELLLKVHSPDMINAVKTIGHFEAASYSAGGTVQATLEIQEGNLDNAFVFTGFGDHHAGKNYFGGGCYFNGAALAIAALREKEVRRFAIIDTDSHHADGTRDIFRLDRDVLHLCFCFQDYGDKYNNVDVGIPYGTPDVHYLQKVTDEVMPRIEAFQPSFIFWEFGYDATAGEYGDKGLTKDCHVGIAKIIKTAADRFCRGRLITILCGGSRRDLATYIIPKIIAVLAEVD
ncbi:MAG TPA: histone deacetylase [Dehalococcoidia bacterium]|nr:histone deacetylase [Dehalococcoidia bacterium]